MGAWVYLEELLWIEDVGVGLGSLGLVAGVVLVQHVALTCEQHHHEVADNQVCE